MGSKSVLLLNATYEPIGLISWQRAVVLVLGGRGELVEQRDGQVLRSTGGETFPFPSVVRLVQYVRKARRGPSRVAPNKRNLMQRDGGICQVEGCGRIGDTIDHVVPRSKGGVTSWVNCVMMCARHNSVKGDRLLSELGWRLKKPPVAPSRDDVLAVVLSADEQWAPFAPAV